MKFRKLAAERNRFVTALYYTSQTLLGYNSDSS